MDLHALRLLENINLFTFQLLTKSVMVIGGHSKIAALELQACFEKCPIPYSVIFKR